MQKEFQSAHQNFRTKIQHRHDFASNGVSKVGKKGTESATGWTELKTNEGRGTWLQS
jgi:hypothetical protein